MQTEKQYELRATIKYNIFCIVLYGLLKQQEIKCSVKFTDIMKAITPYMQETDKTNLFGLLPKECMRTRKKDYKKYNF